MNYNKNQFSHNILGRRHSIWKRARRLEADNRSVFNIREDYQQKTTTPIFQIQRVYLSNTSDMILRAMGAAALLPPPP